MLESLVIPDEENPLLRRTRESFTFANDPDRELSATRYFATEINSGRLSVRDAYEKHWSFVEDKKLWGLQDLPDDECRLLLPDWKPILMDIIAALDSDKAEELVEVVSENYFSTFGFFLFGEYNVFSPELEFAAELAGNNAAMRAGRNSLVDRLMFIETANSGYLDKASALGKTRNHYVASEIMEDLKHETGHLHGNRQAYYFKILSHIGDESVLVPLLEYVLTQPSKGTHISSEFKPEKFTLTDDSSLKYLSNYIADTANQKRHYAVMLLSSLNHPSVIDELTVCLSDSDEEIRQMAAKGIAKKGTISAVKVLVDYYTKNPDATAGFFDFAKIKHPMVAEIILDRIKRTGTDEAHSAINCDDERIVPALIESYPWSGDSDERERTIEALGLSWDKRVVPLLTQILYGALKDEDGLHFEAVAVDAFEYIRDTSVLEPMMKYLFEMPNRYNTHRCTRAFKNVDCREILPQLKNYLENGTDKQKKTALIILTGVEADESFLDLLHPYLDSSDGFRVSDAAEALGRIASEKSLPKLTSKLNTTQPVSDEVARAVARIGGPVAVNALGKHILGFDYELFKKLRGNASLHLSYNYSHGFYVDPMRTNQVTYLGRMKDVRAAPHLLEYFIKCPTGDRFDAVKALVELGYKGAIPILRESYSFREGLNSSSSWSERELDSRITKNLQEIHEKTKPKGYIAPRAA